ncbi:hypothetical protein GCM10009546_12390 [Actinomadura livida]|uniref:FXSXX-COOH protein n=1 Tax=Actinomadura livida TaxID=79909 RepID=A0ABN1DTJ6_9ACTN|nr:hypothetical protein GCM10010208_22700 [Actinomadura livida]
MHPVLSNPTPTTHKAPATRVRTLEDESQRAGQVPHEPTPVKAAAPRTPSAITASAPSKVTIRARDLSQLTINTNFRRRPGSAIDGDIGHAPEYGHA